MPLPKNRKNDQYERLERRERVATLYLQGKTQWDIARLVKVSQGTVSNDLAAIREGWLASTLHDFDAKAAEELAKVGQLEATAWEAWQRSCKPIGKKSRKQSKKRPAERPGDPRFLDQVFRCIAVRLKMLGLLKGTQVTVQQSLIASNVSFFDQLAASIPPGPVPDTIEEALEEHRQRLKQLGNDGTTELIPPPSTNGNGHG